MTLKFETIGNYDGDIVSTILENRKVENIPLFLKPDSSSDTNPFDIENLLQGVQVLLAHLSIGSKMVIVVDADADGFLSATIMYQYLQDICKAKNAELNIDFVVHDNKGHGLTDKIMDELTEKDYDLVIVPDAGSNDSREIDLLYAMGAEVLVIDHHIIEEMPKSGIIVNNQIGDKANKNLVGAGMVLKFCQAMDYTLKLNEADKYLDLAAIGQIADSSDISENEVRNMVFVGIDNIKNPFIKEALKEKDVYFPVPKDLSFSVIPMINSVIRVGTLEQKQLLFRALNNINPEVFEVEKKKKNKTTGKFDKIKVKFNLQQMAVDVAKSCKSKQDREVKKAVEKIGDSIWDEGGVAIGIVEDKKFIKSLTGLVATKLVNKIQKPVLLLREGKSSFAGSGRGYNPTMDSLKDWVQNTEKVEFAQGHDQAFGLKIPKENMLEIRSLSKKVEAKEFTYEVDFVSHEHVDKNIIEEIDKNKFIFGGKVHDPLFAYVGIEVPKKDIIQKGTVLTFKKNGVDFVMYGTSLEFGEKFTGGFNESHKLDFIGRPGVNNWMGKEAIQIVLEAVDFHTIDSNVYEINVDNIVF